MTPVQIEFDMQDAGDIRDLADMFGDDEAKAVLKEILWAQDKTNEPYDHDFCARFGVYVKENYKPAFWRKRLVDFEDWVRENGDDILYSIGLRMGYEVAEDVE